MDSLEEKLKRLEASLQALLKDNKTKMDSSFTHVENKLLKQEEIISLKEEVAASKELKGEGEIQEVDKVAIKEEITKELTKAMEVKMEATKEGWVDVKVTVLTGAGVSAESGIPTFRGEGGLWRSWSATELATPEAFAVDPSLVWEFYHYRRVIVSKCKQNPGHYAIAALERRCKQDGKVFTLLTQNIDGLHQKAGSTATELHGSLWKTRCLTCEDVVENPGIPVCPALEGKGAPDVNAKDAHIPDMQLPRCKKCHGLLRPHVVWFGESLFPDIIKQAYDSLKQCDLLLVIGTSAVVQPAAGFAPIVKGSGGHVAEFNVEDTLISRACRINPATSASCCNMAFPIAEAEGGGRRASNGSPEKVPRRGTSTSTASISFST
ncbi:hypothetical protein L7F22_066726 [Adiantum nelumboides]|nr:hypothetical protein [Adiantum nelumboides]